MTDIEKTTISVRSFATSMWTVVILGGAAIASGAIAWNNVQHQLADHGMKLDTAVQVEVQDKTEINTKLDVLLNGQREMRDTIAAIDRKADATVKRMDDYRAFKWSTPMEGEENREMEQLNPTIKAPDAQKIHDSIIPYTP